MHSDPVIRGYLLPLLAARRPAALLVQEWAIPGGFADVALIGADALEAFEIKSAADDSRRLLSQAAAYASVFPRCTLVTVPARLDRYAAMLPAWWALWTVDEVGGFTERRRGGDNPEARPIRLLWASELAAIGKGLGLRPAAWAAQRAREAERQTGPRIWHSRHLSRWTWEELLAPRLQLPEVCEALRARPSWRTFEGRSMRALALRRQRAT
jgi:hypothetical protein